MFSQSNEPPPSYNTSIQPPPQYVFGDNNPPPSPSLSDLEIEAFGHRLAHLPPSARRSARPALPSPDTQLHLPGSQPIYTPTVSSNHFPPEASERVCATSARPRAVVPSQHVAPTLLDTFSSHTIVPSQPRHVSPTYQAQADLIPNVPTPSTPLATRDRVHAASGRQTAGAKLANPTTRSQDRADDDEDLKFELVVWAVKPVKAVAAARSKKGKAAKVEPITFGPADSNTGVEWESFLEILADLLETKPLLLVVHSFEWKWLKPANSPWLPLRAPSAYESLIRQLRAPPRNVSGSYIIIRMEQPIQQPVDRTKPWSSQAPNPSNAFSLDDDDDDEDDERKRKKAPRFDDDVDDHLAEIETKYAPGNCDIHPDKECFHHRPTDNHFELTRARKIFWAAKIRDGKASILVPPLSSNLFNAKSATKVPKTPSTPIDSTPRSAPAPVHPPVTPMHPHMAGYPYMYPPYAYPPPPPAPFHMYSPSMYQPPPPPLNFPPLNFYGPGPSSHVKNDLRGRREPRSSPPRSSPPPVGGSVEAFCEQYNFKDSVCSGLKELGFKIGDDLSAVTESQWEHVGIPPLTVIRIIKLYRKYKVFLQDN